LNSDIGLLRAICNEAQDLVEVGWPQEMVPRIISGKTSGVEVIDRHNIAKLKETGVDTTKAVEVALDRCP
jgi:hypothetical protein